MGKVPAYSCAELSNGESVRIVEESAVIIWDAQHKTEHFIRSARFDSKGQSVGFIVPTPSIPKLAEVNENVFGELEWFLQPKVVYKERAEYDLASYFLAPKISHTFNTLSKDLSSEWIAPDASVQVIETKHIGDFDAAILRAANADALNNWLKKYGYLSNPAFEKWLDVYIQKGWIVTAFKFVKKNKRDSGISSPLVRMSFQTDRPFFPYREPQRENKNAKQKSRSLRIFLFAPNRMQAQPGKFDESSSWPGKVIWADDTNQHDFEKYHEWRKVAQNINLPETIVRQAKWMTVFEDTSTPRPGTDDVSFAPAPDKSTLPPPIVKYKAVRKHIYIEWIVLAVIVLGGVFIIRKR
jgi:hypothetical protein